MKRLLYFLGFGLILLTTGGCSMYRGQTEESTQEEMMRIVKSEEAKEVFERTIRNIDSNAFTDKGIIQSYEIDYDSVKHNPMGGISVKIIINKDNDLYIQNILDKGDDEKLRNASGSPSIRLNQLLEER